MALRWLFALLCWCCLLGQALARPIEVPLFEGGEGLDFYQDVALRYQQRTGQAIDLYGDPRIDDKLRVRLLEGDFPEVTNASLNYWSLLDHDQLMPLDEFLDAPAWDGLGSWRESFLPGSLDRYSRHGKTYGIPLVYVVWSVYYNKAMFAEHGWQPPRTWDEFFALSEQVKAAGFAPLAFQGRYPYYARVAVENSYYHLAGREAYYAQQRLEPGSFANPEMEQALGLIARVAREDFQPGALGMSHTEAQLEFFKGRAAMLFCGSWLYSEMQDNIPEGFQLGAVNLPLPDSPRADPEAIFIDSGYFFVFKHSPNPAGGADFLRLLTARETAGRFAAERGLPVAVTGANTRLNTSMAAVGEQLRGVKRTFGAAAGEVPPGMAQAWNDVLHKVLSGKTEPAEAAAALERAAELVRNRAQHPDQVEVRYPFRALLFLGVLAAGLVLGLGSGPNVSAPSGEPGPRGLFLGPSLALYTLFFVLPALASLGFCLTRWDSLSRPEYVGLLHFRRLLLESDGFWIALGNNLYLMLVIPAVVVPLALFLANCLNQGLWGSSFFRVAFFFPNLLGVAGILLWQQLYNPQGPINRLFGSDTAWLSTDHLYHALIPMGVWGACGFNMVLYLAAMQSVPAELYEAAELDGATEGHKFFQITLPMIWDTLAASLIFMLIGGMKAFEAIWLLMNQSPTTDTHVVGTLMVRSMFTDMRIGEAAAIACLLFAMVFVGSAVTARFTESEAIER